MDKLNNKNTKEKIADFKAAKNEPNFNAVDLLAEIIPLLDDYFLGDFAIVENGIHATFPNGQKFRIYAEEIS